MRRGVPLTLVMGVAVIAGCEALLFVDVQARGGLVIPTDRPLPVPDTALLLAARWVAVNMTALCWVGYLLVFDGLLVALGRYRRDPGIASIRARPHRFVVAWLTSIPVWCVFDWVNFYYMDAWRYHGLPPAFSQRLVGYFIAFAAISPGMFLAAQLYQHLGLRRLHTPAWPRNLTMAWGLTLGVPAVLSTVTIGVILTQTTHVIERHGMVILGLILLAACDVVRRIYRCMFVTSFVIGLALLIWAMVLRSPISNLLLWIALIYLLDPINHGLGSPSLLRDWRAGRWGRTLALFAGGATCGLCWEFWNYWALAKWTYHLPFLGAAGEYRYFEMPWLGFLGFLPFAAECWVMLNTIVALLERAKLRAAELLPDDWAIM